jgi:hypothetical protein
MTRRADLRDVVADALEVAPWAYDFTRVKSWSQALGSDTLPVFGVSVTRERTEYHSKEDKQHLTEVKIAFCREGNDCLEDDLDTDASVVEEIVYETLEDAVFNIQSSEIEFDISAQDGAQRIGVCVITFDCDTRSDIN